MNQKSKIGLFSSLNRQNIIGHAELPVVYIPVTDSDCLHWETECKHLTRFPWPVQADYQIQFTVCLRTLAKRQSPEQSCGLLFNTLFIQRKTTFKCLLNKQLLSELILPVEHWVLLCSVPILQWDNILMPKCCLQWILRELKTQFSGIIADSKWCSGQYLFCNQYLIKKDNFVTVLCVHIFNCCVTTVNAHMYFDNQQELVSCRN